MMTGHCVLCNHVKSSKGCANIFSEQGEVIRRIMDACNTVE